MVHYLVLLSVSGLIFLITHIPPKAVNLDALIHLLVAVETFLVAPRKLMLWLWPWEQTPAYLGLILTCLNSLSWGLTLNVIKSCWRKLTL